MSTENTTNDTEETIVQKVAVVTTPEPAKLSIPLNFSTLRSLLILITILFFFFDVGNINGRISDWNYGRKNDHIKFVQSLSPVTFPNTTYAKAFRGFFSDYSWTHTKINDTFHTVEYEGFAKNLSTGGKVRVNIIFWVNHDTETVHIGEIKMGGRVLNAFEQERVLRDIFTNK